MPAINPDYYRADCRQRLIAALLGIVHGVGATDAEGHPTLVPVLRSARKASTFIALSDAAMHLQESFTAQELEIVDRACARLGVTRTTDRKDQIAQAILDALARRRAQ